MLCLENSKFYRDFRFIFDAIHENIIHYLSVFASCILCPRYWYMTDHFLNGLRGRISSTLCFIHTINL